MAQPDDFGRLDRCAHRTVHPRRMDGRVGQRRDRGPVRQRLGARLALKQPDAAPHRIQQLDTATAPRNLVRRQLLRFQCLDVDVKIRVVRHPKRGPDEAVFATAHGHSDTGRLPGPAREQALRTGLDDVHPKITPKAFGGREYPFLPAQERELNGTAQRLRSRQGLDMRGQAAFGLRFRLAKNGGRFGHGAATLETDGSAGAISARRTYAAHNVARGERILEA